MSCILLSTWITIATLLTTVVHVTDSCSSAFGSRKSKRTIEFVYESTSTEPTETTILPTTIKLTNDIMTYNEEHKTPKTRKSDEKLIEEYRDHLELCEGIHALELCLNGGTCKVLKRHQLYLCVCADDFTGKRCEEKSLEGTYGGGMIVRKSRITETIAPSADSTSLDPDTTTTESSNFNQPESSSHSSETTKVSQNYHLVVPLKPL